MDSIVRRALEEKEYIIVFAGSTNTRDSNRRLQGACHYQYYLPYLLIPILVSPLMPKREKLMPLTICSAAPEIDLGSSFSATHAERRQLSGPLRLSG